MAKLCIALLFTLALTSRTFASENGGYYICNEETLASDNQCIFELNGAEPDDWIHEPVLHNVDRSVGTDFCRGVESYAGDMLSVSPKPWVNGDVLVASSSAVTEDDWNGYTLIFELMAPLRDMIMYEPDKLDVTTWETYTKALTDCKAKIDDYVAVDRSGGAAYSTSQVYEYILDPKNKDIHHYLLQYLEEGTMDLICLSTSIVMDHCDTVRAAAGFNEGDHCNCWFDAYQAIYGECPVVDLDFITCANTDVPTQCADVVAVVDGGAECAGDDTGDETMPGPSGVPDMTGRP